MCAARRKANSHSLLTSCLGIALTVVAAQSVQAFTPRPGALLAGPNVPPNVVILLGNSSSMYRRLDGTATSDDSQRKIGIASAAMKDVLGENRGLRYGLFMFNSGETGSDGAGGRMLLEAASVALGTGDRHLTTLNRYLTELDPQASSPTYTPLAETYYEITRYMRGLTPYFDGSGVTQFTSPIEYRCQRSFALVLTDEVPTQEFDIESKRHTDTDPDRDNPAVVGENNLPNWRGSSKPFYLTELATFANQTDLRNTRRHGLLLDGAGKSWDDLKFPSQTMQTYVIGFGFGARFDGEAKFDHVSNPLAAAAQAGGGRYFSADSAEELGAAFRAVLGKINSGPGAGSSSAASANVLIPGETLFYRTQYDPDDWSGAVEAVPVEAFGKLGSPAWTTNTTYVPGDRTVQTSNASTGAMLLLGPGSARGLAPSQIALLASEARRAGVSGTDDISATNMLLDWVRGRNVTPLRERRRLMGDIINSPLRHSAYDTVSIGDGSEAFEAYRDLRLKEMIPSLVVGSNDGLLHVLDADTGVHRMGYLPVSAYRFLGTKASALYGGSNYAPGVDGPIALADVKAGIWTTMAVAGMGPGGRSLIGLRLFDEASGNGALGAMWERNPAHAGWSNLGFTYATPAFGRMADGTPVVVLGNGYGSPSGKASLIIARAVDGEVVRELVVPGRQGIAGGNGLSSAMLVSDASGILQTAYAGDLHGQMWKFDLGRRDASRWRVAFNEQPLFVAAEDQPIIVQPQVAEHPEGGRMVLFGTGKFLEQEDIASTALQAFYGVWDRPRGEGNLASGDLQTQSITGQPVVSGRATRVVTRNRVDWTSQSGWYLPLAFNDNQIGERVAGNILLRGNRVVFNTGYLSNTSVADPCEGRSGDGWLMALDILNGSMLPYSVLDTNGDGVVNDADVLSAGLDLDVGLPGDITVLRGDGTEHYLIDGSAGTETLTGLSFSLFRRIMWRQLM